MLPRGARWVNNWGPIIVSQMDGVRQQNSALVEEKCATAKTLEQQARRMEERISFFNLGEAAEPLPRTVRAA